MIIRTTLDPVSLNDVPDLENHPCVMKVMEIMDWSFTSRRKRIVSNISI